jgi:ketosteroid isomerase-like protein
VTASPNLDLVRSIYAAWERGDWSSARWAHAEIEWVVADGPQPGVWRGLAEMAHGMREFLGGLEGLRMQAEEYRELDDLRVLVLVHQSGRGRTSGLELGRVGARSATVFRIRDGKVAKLSFYWNCERALADLGLTPEGDAS